MRTGEMKVLLLGKDAKGLSSLVQFLETRGCHCLVAESAERCSALLDKYEFQLILTRDRMHQANWMAPFLKRVNCRVFCYYPVENGCWWVPLAGNGDHFIRAPALCLSEFVSTLDQIVAQNNVRQIAA
jgi:hypothetical protein